MDKESAEIARKWLAELKMAKREDEKWLKRSKKIVRRYRDERSGIADVTKRYNILWANIQTMLPALYGRTPKSQVGRRNKDQNPVARTSAQIIERALQYEIDHYGTFDAANKSAVLDRLLPGRGVVWVRFEMQEYEPIEGQGAPYAKSCEDYVYWEDFRCSPARCWEEVTWVARRVYMSKAEGAERFGEEFKQVPLTHEPIGLDELKNQGAELSEIESLKKAQIWEIWDKSTQMVRFVAEGYEYLLDEKPDPYNLDSFWPCPKPLFATQTTDTLVPVPDYSLYQDQAEELDKLTNRIAMLVEAVKVVGVYDASQSNIQRMLSEGVNNTLIPVDNWSSFSEKGGIKGVVDFLPLDSVLIALNECYKARESAKQVIYEVTGLSDIIRGASMASETATAQQIKSQYASLRLKRLQLEVAQFVSEVMRIKAQMMADLYPAEQLIAMSGIESTQDAQYAEQAIMLLKQEPVRNYLIEVASDSLVEMDEQAEKQSRIEFLTATGGFIQQALPVIQNSPDMAPLMAEMLLFGVRAFKAGRPLEAAFDTLSAKLSAPPPPPQPQAPPPPDPEQIKMQGQMQLEQARVQLEQEKMQAQNAIEQFRAQQAVELEQMKQMAETERAQYKAQLDAQTKLQIAEMQNVGSIELEKQKQRPAIDAEVISTAQELQSNILEQLSETLNTISSQMEEGLGKSKAEIVDIMSSPKQFIRGDDGKIIGVEVNGQLRSVVRSADGKIQGVQ